MAGSRSTEPHKLEEENDREVTDRLSSLPNSVLFHIMYFLPTRTSIETMSLVSCRWLHLWKDLQAFHFYGRNLDEHSFKSLLLFVNAVLSLRKSRDIRNFHLKLTFNLSGGFYDNFHLDCIRTWILVAIGPHLQQLFLYIINGAVIVIPRSLFTNCTSLISLSLVGPINMEVKHSSVHFPSLKMLSIGAEIVGKNELVYFLSGCPKLETFKVWFYFFDEELVPKALVTPSSSFESLKSANDNLTWTYFDINEGLFKLGIFGNFHSMLEPFLHVFSLPESEFVNPILNLIRDDKSEFHKHLRHDAATSCPCSKLSRISCFNSNLLVDVLGKFHMLQVLIFQSNKEEPPPLRTWQPELTIVSECLKSHLTYVHIEGYHRLEDELIFAEYILRNGLVMKTMLCWNKIGSDRINP